jgi:hypothetical protein
LKTEIPYRYIFFVLLLLTFMKPVEAQQDIAYVYGTVKDSSGKALSDVNVLIINTGEGTNTDEQGFYRIAVPAGKKIQIKFSYIGNYRKFRAGPFAENKETELHVLLDSDLKLKAIEIESKNNREREIAPMQSIDPSKLQVIPSTTGKLTAIIRSLPGVSSNNEMGTAYSVRGGNFDENLVYINDIEIFRPFIIRSAQQEGLPVWNAELVESIRFSAGGFEAKYGDKMSSVLDIRYKEPEAFHGSVAGGLLDLNTHLEGSWKDKFSYLVGMRRRSNKYLLNSLDVQGDYKPLNVDFQTYLTFKPSNIFSISYFSYFGRNEYQLVPQDRETTYGTSDLVLRLKVYYEGREKVAYDNYLNALVFKYQCSEYTFLKLTGSIYHTRELEYFDVLGEYWLAQVDTDPGSETFQEASKDKLGIGSLLKHARNRLYANIVNLGHTGETRLGRSHLQWGAKVQYEQIQDFLREWNQVDSAGYNIPANDDLLVMDYFLNTEIELNSMRYSAFLQNTFTLNDSANSFLSAGIRAHYWDYNNEYFITPRLQLAFEPNRKNNLRYLQDTINFTRKKNIRYKIAAGLYYQPAFYRELRDRSGQINPEIRAQKSYQLVLGTDMHIQIWDRPFNYRAELYFKYLDDIIPYDIDDIRIRYHATNDAIGYATGIDMQLYGEFVRGLPSWAGISLMSTRENLAYDDYILTDAQNGESKIVDPGFLPRPTDQRMQFSLYFQDFLPENPTYKVHLNFIFATPLPFGPPNNEQLRNQGRMRAYKRVDIGFSKQIAGGKDSHSVLLKKIESIWITAELFNMFGVENVISYFWVKDVNNALWAVPNYLTARRLNATLSVRF